MRFYVKLFVVLAALGAAAFFAWQKTKDWLKERNKPDFNTAEVVEGTIRITRNATGEVKPVLSLHVGSFVSGPIEELLVDFNDEVKEGQILAKIDPRIYKAAVASNTAALANRRAEVLRVKAQLQRAINDEKRSLALAAENKDFISQTDLDQYRFSRMGLEAQLTIAEASVEQAVANLENAQANLEYTEVKAPSDGIVTDRKISPGQTLAAQFQTPEMFIIAPDMKKKIHIFASIDEADIGLIREAKENDQPVVFKVEAYPDEMFTEGVIEQIRLSPVSNQNVVTYPVVVATPNPDMKLLPGMTAELTFQIEVKKDIIKVPSAALRYMPDNKEHVHEEDHDKLDLTYSLNHKEDEGNLENKPLDEKDESRRQGTKRHVWILDGEKLRAKEIHVGVSDYKYREVISGELKPGDKVATGLKPKEN